MTSGPKRAERRLDLVLLWHLHQPDYRDYATGEFRLPWVYLHAIKDYSDMAWHLEHHPGVQVVVNFAPVLLDQIEDYTDQFVKGKLRDPLLRLLTHPDDKPISEEHRTFIVERCFHANHERMIEPYPAYKDLHNLFTVLEARGPDAMHYLSDQYYFDLLTWYHLCWTGETVRRGTEMVTRLMAKGMRFSHRDRLELFKVIGGIISGIIPRYAKLAASGRVELSTTPHYHPLAPLLIRFDTAREAEPQLTLPQSPEYPGGYERVESQLRTAIADHTRRFGEAPAGVWPAEGAISSAFIRILGAQGCKWTASGAKVLMNSLHGREEDLRGKLYRPYRHTTAAPDLALFFRDDRLSDLIGFEYAKWNGHDAAANFVSEIEAIASDVSHGETPLVSVILDGENCWEYYPYNGYYFLEELYRILETHSAIRTTTYRAYLSEASTGAATLDRITSGSWVYGNFTTWIGSADKNRAWDLLCAAKHSFDLVIASGRLNKKQVATAYRQLAACEASDWFWWLGDYNPSFAVESFDQLYRDNLGNLYRLLKLSLPAHLALPLSHGKGTPETGGAMRRAVEQAEGT
ncbi:MAG TPA: glycoside hydrolase family 57 protein [Burkholderiales bacterium]|nr:glycoside hydrolase family 57 protein [Burkholderiales bacterium]